jgi:hypothetical protein
MMKRKILGLALILFLAVSAARAEDCVHINPPSTGPQTGIDFGGSIWVKAYVDTTNDATFPNGQVPGQWLGPAVAFDSVGFQWDTIGGADPPPDGLKVPIYLTNVPECLQGTQIWVEYDSVLFNWVGYTPGANLSSSQTNVTINPNWTGRTCSVSDEGHDSKTLIVQMINYSPSGCLLSPGQARTKLIDLHFMPKENWANVDWAGWETTAAFAISCSQYDPSRPGISTVWLEFVDRTVNPYNIWYYRWGDPNVDLSTANTCWGFDLLGGSGAKADWCSRWTVFRSCLDCPGCSYWGECYDESQIIDCEKYGCAAEECACHYDQP